MKYIIENAIVITMDAERRVLPNGYIGIEGDKILFVEDSKSPMVEQFLASGDVHTISASGKIALPGLVNAHTHTPMSVLRGWGSDLSLQDWLFTKILPAEETLSHEDIYWGGMLGMVEQIRSGITCFADMYMGMEIMEQVTKEAGLRANLSGPFVKSQAAYGDLLSDFNARQNSGFIKGYAIIHAIYTTPEERIREVAAMAKSIGTGIHIHVSETKKEVDDVVATHGKSPVEMLAEWGVFDVPALAAHCVHVDAEDIAIFQEKGVGIAHCPSSNLKLGSGIAPIPELLNSGLAVGIGTDGVASNNNLNILEEMHLASLIHKGYHQDPLLLPASKALEMATLHGAKALGFADTIGSLSKGMAADIILVDGTSPHMTPLHDAVASMVYNVQGSDVETVMVGGKLLMEDRELPHIDEERILYEVRTIGKRLRAL